MIRRADQIALAFLGWHLELLVESEGETPEERTITRVHYLSAQLGLGAQVPAGEDLVPTFVGMLTDAKAARLREAIGRRLHEHLQAGEAPARVQLSREVLQEWVHARARGEAPPKPSWWRRLAAVLGAR